MLLTEGTMKVVGPDVRSPPLPSLALDRKVLMRVGMWTIDPIDGTKGFLRGEQYAVCLAFLVDAKVQIGVIGCPNLPIRHGGEGGKGCIFVAVRGQGARQVRPPLSPYPFFAIDRNGRYRYREQIQHLYLSHYQLQDHSIF